MEQSQKGTKRPRSRESKDTPEPKLQRTERVDPSEISEDAYERLVRLCAKREGLQRWIPEQISTDDWRFLGDLSIDAGIVGFRHVQPSVLCQRLLTFYTPRYNPPNREDLFTIVREYIEKSQTYNPHDIDFRTMLVAKRIASAYRPYDVAPLVKHVLDSLRTIVSRSSTETNEVISSDELLITDMITDLLTWLNSLDKCGISEVVYVEHYPVTVDTDARSVLAHPGILASALNITTPSFGYGENRVVYIPDPESPQARQWLENMAVNISKRGFDRDGYDEYGVRIADHVRMLVMFNLDRFALDMFWFVLDDGNQIVGVYGYREFHNEDGSYRLWGFGYLEEDKDGTPYLGLLLDCDPTLECETYTQHYLDQNGWKLVVGCGPVYNPYDPEYALFWRLMDGAGLRVADPPQ